MDRKKLIQYRGIWSKIRNWFGSDITEEKLTKILKPIIKYEIRKTNGKETNQKGAARDRDAGGNGTLGRTDRRVEEPTDTGAGGDR